MEDETICCEVCGTEMDQDCFGSDRCPECDPPCPGCASGPAPDEDPNYGDLSHEDREALWREHSN